ncbi:unnamed protein product [Neospora caninum Liverpool]|uniref:Tetratricopeptide repeat-containing protein n=1 Tax=Neospora caninum (strain Liverpool) TaxID=572307 RepID=F0VPD1_NEOCL|nr:uncharacterized protein NCLIV_060015 [Neospora caninum Liverpool]CBZ55577.1 unnamed protein product [Neospora caninum Liverpool]|eukprot:XP_003885605.1 uncharacterized protein NCLIV_060015 [Neospora caninum Liverpool]
MSPDDQEKPCRRSETLSEIPVDRESGREAIVTLLQAAFCKGPREVSAGLHRAVSDTRGGELLQAEAGNPAEIGSLLPAFKDGLGRTALHYACLGKRPVNAEWILKACPTIVDYKDSTGETALMMACRAGDVVMVNLLLNFGADVNKRSQTGVTALHLAAESGDEACVRALVDAGAVNCFAEASGSPLQYAVMSNHYGVTEVLLQKGADPDYPFNVQGSHLSVFPPPLLFACNARQDSIAELLLNNNADPNLQDEHNWTALQCAAENGAYRAVVALLKAGADPDVVTQGLTAFDLAMQHQNWAIADILKDKTALLIGKDQIFTALHEARRKRYEMEAFATEEHREADDEIVDTEAHQQQVDDAMKAKADGDAFNESGDYALAIDKYTQALEQMPVDKTTKEARAMLYASRSMMYISLGDLESAETDAHKATELDPLWSKGYAVKARVYKAKNQTEEYTKHLYEACTRQKTRDDELISELKKAITVSRRNQTKQQQAPPTVVEING